MITSVVFFLSLSLTVIAGLVSPTVRDYTSGRLNFDSKKVYYLTESGSEDYLYRLLNSFVVADNETLNIENNTVTTTLYRDSGDTYIRSDGSMQSLDRKIKVLLSTTQEASFNYGLQVGEGGVTLTGSDILGNVFSNGPITGDTSSTITGTAISASSNTFTEVASNTSVISSITTFGNTTLEQDLAQGFQVTSSGIVSRVSLYLNRVNGLPGDITVRIVNDAGRRPGSTTLASGTLLASNVGVDYDWIDVSLSTTATLSVGVQYWLIFDVDFSASAAPYYSTPKNSNYPQGVGVTGRHSDYWSETSVIGDFDYWFKIFVTGPTGLITGSSGSQWNPLRVGTVSGTAQANTVNYVNSTGNIYCQNGTGNNKPCTIQQDPQPESFPIPDSYIAGWKAEAETGGVYNGNYSVGWAGATLGPKKIDGNLTVSGGGTLTVTGTLWVTGTINLSGSGRIILSSSYGSDDGLIVSDGTITIGSGSSVQGSGVSGSYMMLLTTSNSSSAINISGGSGAVILYAANGTLNISGGASVNSATAYRIVVSGGSDLIYESGLANVEFGSGGSVALTLSIGDWDEVE